jgi:hypothetical protein
MENAPTGSSAVRLEPCSAPVCLVTGALEIETKRNKTLNDEKRNEVRSFIKKHKLQVIRGDIHAILP